MILADQLIGPGPATIARRPKQLHLTLPDHILSPEPAKMRCRGSVFD
jgi:hypothetical protein